MARLLIFGIAIGWYFVTAGTALAQATSEQFSPRVRALLDAMTLA